MVAAPSSVSIFRGFESNFFVGIICYNTQVTSLMPLPCNSFKKHINFIISGVTNYLSALASNAVKSFTSLLLVSAITTFGLPSLSFTDLKVISIASKSCPLTL